MEVLSLVKYVEENFKMTVFLNIRIFVKKLASLEEYFIQLNKDFLMTCKINPPYLINYQKIRLKKN